MINIAHDRYVVPGNICYLFLKKSMRWRHLLAIFTDEETDATDDHSWPHASSLS